MSHRPLKATDKRRSGLSDNVREKVAEDSTLAAIFNDRRPNGKGKSLSNGKGRKSS